MNVNPPILIQSRLRKSRPHRWSFQESATMSVSNCQVVKSSNNARFSELFDRSDKASGSRIERVPWDRFVMALARLDCFKVLLRSIPRGFAVAYEPCDNASSASLRITGNSRLTQGPPERLWAFEYTILLSLIPIPVSGYQGHATWPIDPNLEMGPISAVVLRTTCIVQACQISMQGAE